MSIMKLTNIHKGKTTKPDKILLYGTEGIGKSTFGSSAPNPIFIAAEEGIKHLDVHSFPEPESIDDVLDGIRELRAGGHDRKTLVIDTVDWLEPHVFNDVIGRNKDWKNIEDVGYGKGYSIALDGWRKMLADLDRLRAEQGMEIILLAHAQAANFNNPAGPDYTRYELAMNKKASSLLKQWADSVLFATYDELVKKDKGELRAKVSGSGARVIHTERRAAWDAKNRYNLPAVLPLDYNDYAEARAANQPASMDALRADLDTLLAELKPEAKLKSTILAFATDASKTAMACNRVRALIQEESA